MMKNWLVILVLLVSINLVSAVGIKWGTEAEYLAENTEKCIPYGVYNPSEKDITVVPEVSGDLANAITSKSVGETIVKAGTSSKEAEMIDFCFKVGNVYEPDCLIGNYLCEQKCEGNEKTFTGYVAMQEKVDEAKASGSASSVGASAPLKLVVECVPYEREWSSAYMVCIIIVLVIILILLYKKYSTPKIDRDREKLKKLQDKVKSEEKKK